MKHFRRKALGVASLHVTGLTRVVNIPETSRNPLIHPIDNKCIDKCYQNSHLSMADEPTLPKLGWNPVTESFSNSRRRKRVLSSPPVSSDPAIFSSDDDPSADNYTQERRKKKYRGPWYQQQLASDSGSLDQNENDQHMKGKRARTFERQYDSGIFMGSDGTDIDEVMENLPTTRGSALSLRPGGLSRSAQTDRPIPSPEELARGQIDRCLEEGEESIDLSWVFRVRVTPLANLTTCEQVSRPHNTIECHYPTPRYVYPRSASHSRRVLANGTRFKSLPRRECPDKSSRRAIQT